jgi:DNA-binding CsgD family transcriptional regulator
MHRKTKSTEADALDASLQRMGVSFDAYTRLYPDLLPRIKAILASRDPALRAKVAVLRAAARDADGTAAVNLARRYGLTPTQARIAIYLVNGGTLTDYAAEQKISPQTVRTHLKAIFSKTGASRQAELTSILAGIGKRVSR